MTRTLRQIEAHRKGTALLQVRGPGGLPLTGVRISAEQESHAFPFACVRGDLSGFSEDDRRRYQSRLQEVFNRVLGPGPPPAAVGGGEVFDVPRGAHLAELRRMLDEFARRGKQIDVCVSGQSLLPPGREAVEPASLSERDSARRVIEFYTLCFAHPAVRQIVWRGLTDREPGVGGTGLLRTDLSPRPAHAMLRKLIGTVWHSRSRGRTDRRGLFRFRGFFGTYRIVVARADSAAHVSALDLGRHAEETLPQVIDVSG